MVSRKTCSTTLARRRYNRERLRNAPGRSFYRTERWRALRKAFLAKNPVCGHCGAPARHVDHVRPHRGDVGLFFDVRNLYPLCHSCHSSKTVTSDGGFGNPRKDVTQPEPERCSACSLDGEPLDGRHPWNSRS